MLPSLLGAALAGLLLVGSAPPQEGGPAPASPTESDREDRLETIREQIQALEAQLEALAGERASVIRQFETTDVELALRRQELAQVRRRQQHLEEELSERTEQVRELEGELEKVKGDLADRVVALYRMGPLSYARLVVGADSASDLLANYQLLNHLAQQDRRLILSVRDRRARLEAARAELQETRSELVQARAAAAAAVAALEEKQQERRRMLGRIDRESELMRQSLDEKERRARELEEMIGRFAAEATEPGAESFAVYKGRLPWPADGPLVGRFGRRRHPVYDTYTVSKGIEIGAERGTPVEAVYPGKVVFADWYTGYGLLVIIDHGGQFFSLYGHLQGVQARVGAHVEAGTVIGTVGETGSLEGPALYFEIRQGTRALNPAQWLEDR